MFLVILPVFQNINKVSTQTMRYDKSTEGFLVFHDKVVRGLNESYLKVELDISGVDGTATGQTKN